MLWESADFSSFKAQFNFLNLKKQCSAHLVLVNSGEKKILLTSGLLELEFLETVFLMVVLIFQ